MTRIVFGVLAIILLLPGFWVGLNLGSIYQVEGTAGVGKAMTGSLLLAVIALILIALAASSQKHKKH